MNLNWEQVAKQFKLPSGWGGLTTQGLHVHIQLQKEELAYLYSLVAVKHTQQMRTHHAHTQVDIQWGSQSVWLGVGGSDYLGGGTLVAQFDCGQLSLSVQKTEAYSLRSIELGIYFF